MLAFVAIRGGHDWGFTSTVVGEGGFRTIYLACLTGSLKAVKVHHNNEHLHRVSRQ
jgi:hypothetical protein